MKRAEQFIVFLVALLILSACASQFPRPSGEMSPDGLERMTGTSFDELWVRPGISFASFGGVMLEPTSVVFREVGERRIYEVGRVHAARDAFPIPADQRERIEQSFQRRLDERLRESRKYQRVEASGPAVLVLHASLLDYVSLVPEEWPQREVFVSSVGEATLAIELRDGATGELLARASRHDEAEPAGSRLIRANAVTSWAEVDRQMFRWGDELRRLLDQLHGVGGQ
jgi:hypothetical protein